MGQVHGQGRVRHIDGRTPGKGRVIGRRVMAKLILPTAGSITVRGHRLLLRLP
jgi:hypothetical protein